MNMVVQHAPLPAVAHAGLNRTGVVVWLFVMVVLFGATDGLVDKVSVAFEPPVLVGASSTTHYWFPAHLARSSEARPSELIVTAQNRGDAATVVSGNITEFLISSDGGESWQHLMQNGPPEYASPGRAHEQGAFIGPEQTGRDALVVIGLEGFPKSGSQNATNPAGGGGFLIPAATIVDGSVKETFNLSMAGFPRLAGSTGLAMGDNAVKLSSGTWLMLAYGFAWPTGGCIVDGPPGKRCKYTLYVMAGKNSTTDTPVPVEWQYRASISDPKNIGAEGPCEPQFTQLHDGRILLLMRYTSTPLMKSYSSDEGVTWTEPVATPLWSVYANVQRLGENVLVATSGRPGIGLWVSSDGVGDKWQFFNLAAIHNGLLPRPLLPGRNGTTALGFHPTVANISSFTSPDVSPPQTTGYTGLTLVGCESSSASTTGTRCTVCVTYDRLADGWAGPSKYGAWGDTDMVYSMRVHIDTERGLAGGLKSDDVEIPAQLVDENTNVTTRYTNLRLTKAQYVQHTYNNSLLKQQLTETNANTMSWELWSSNEQSYLSFVSFLEATKDFKVNGEQLAVWVTLMPPTETEHWKNYTGCVKNASELCPAALPYPYGNDDAGWFCCGKPAPGNSCPTHDCCAYPGSLEACQGAHACVSNVDHRPVCPKGYNPNVDTQGMPPGTSVCSIPGNSNLTAWNETALINQSKGFRGCNDYAGWAEILGRLGAQYPHLTAVNIDDFSANLLRHGPHLEPFTQDLVMTMVSRLHSGGVKFIPTHYHSAKGQRSFVLDSFPWLVQTLDGALFYFLGECSDSALPDFATQIAQFDTKLAAASNKQLHVGLYFSHMGGCNNNGTTVPPPSFAYDSLEMVLQLATNGSSKVVRGAHIYTFEVPRGPCDASDPASSLDKGCLVRDLFSRF